MSFWKQIRRLAEDPPPAYAFEISQSGIAYSRSDSSELAFEPLEPDVLAVSPLKDNVVRPEILFDQVRRLAPSNGKKTRRTAALILPDYSTRVAVLDFDSFPSDKAEQESLVQFRMKKSIPFEIESARMSYRVQSSGGGGRPYEVVVAVVALEIVARYEAAFRAAGFAPGHVTTSTLATLALVPGDGVRVLAKLSGDVLTVSVMDGKSLKLLRCVELPVRDEREVMSVLYPTFAYVEDQMDAPRNLFLCGLSEMADAVSDHCQQELGMEVELLASRLGEPGDENAGLLGYLESVGRVA